MALAEQTGEFYVEVVPTTPQFIRLVYHHFSNGGVYSCEMHNPQLAEICKSRTGGAPENLIRAFSEQVPVIEVVDISPGEDAISASWMVQTWLAEHVPVSATLRRLPCKKENAARTVLCNAHGAQIHTLTASVRDLQTEVTGTQIILMLFLLFAIYFSIYPRT